MYNRLFATVLIITALLAGCTAKENADRRNDIQRSITNIPKGITTKQINTVGPNKLETPDLAGGTESAGRKPEHNKPFPRALYYSGLPSKRLAALTFDDGPDTNYTPQILDILRKEGVKATFFIVGVRAQQHPDAVKRIKAEGHAIGNHSWDHPDLDKLNSAQIKDELDKTERILDTIVGYNPGIFRPPYGAADTKVIQQVASMGYKIIDWSVDTRDWAGTPTTQIMNYVKEEFHPGGIILQHCAGGKGEDLSNTVKALPEIISLLKGQGYGFVTVPQLLGIPASK